MTVSDVHTGFCLLLQSHHVATLILLTQLFRLIPINPDWERSFVKLFSFSCRTYSTRNRLYGGNRLNKQTDFASQHFYFFHSNNNFNLEWVYHLTICIQILTYLYEIKRGAQYVFVLCNSSFQIYYYLIEKAINLSINLGFSSINHDIFTIIFK